MLLLRTPSFLLSANQASAYSFALVLMSWCGSAMATNGINLIGFGAESTLMAGADTAVARDTSALNTNPAGLTQIKGQAFDGFGTMLRTIDLAHKDSFDNDVHASNRYTFLGGGGYANSLDSLPCTAGVGLFAQGGAGGVFKHVNNAFGTSDELSSLFGIAKIIPGMGCQVTDKLSIGASLALIYASLDQKVFPDTSSPLGFAGYKIEGTQSLKAGFKLGAMYQLTPMVTLGASYTSKTELPLTGGELTADYDGLGKVKYQHASVKGFALPQEVAVGIALKPTDQWLLSFKLNWIDWSGAIKDVTIRATEPGNALAPPVYQLDQSGDWKNQLVFATGAAYTLNDKTTLYAGYNYGRNPVPKENSSSLLAAILEHHFTLGAARQITPEWKLTGGMEYVANAKVDYTSPLFGNAEVRNEALFLHFMLSRRW